MMWRLWSTQKRTYFTSTTSVIRIGCVHKQHYNSAISRFSTTENSLLILDMEFPAQSNSNKCNAVYRIAIPVRSQQFFAYTTRGAREWKYFWDFRLWGDIKGNKSGRNEKNAIKLKVLHFSHTALICWAVEEAI